MGRSEGRRARPLSGFAVALSGQGYPLRPANCHGFIAAVAPYIDFRIFDDSGSVKLVADSSADSVKPVLEFGKPRNRQDLGKKFDRIDCVDGGPGVTVANDTHARAAASGYHDGNSARSIAARPPYIHRGGPPATSVAAAVRS